MYDDEGLFVVFFEGYCGDCVFVVVFFVGLYDFGGWCYFEIVVVEYCGLVGVGVVEFEVVGVVCVGIYFVGQEGYVD